MTFGFGFGLTRGGTSSGPFAAAALDLDFLTGTLDSRVTFTRSGSVATYVNSSGYITTAGANVPRFDYDPATLAPRGLLIEQAATNLLLYSEQMQQAATWTTANTTVTADQILAPDNTLTADMATVSVASANNLRQFVTVTASTTYTFSWYIYRGTATNLKYSIYNQSGLSDIIPSTDYYSSTQAGKWVRMAVTFTTPVGCTQIYVNINRDGTSTGTFYTWGAQLETGSFATSYIPTTTATVTRGLDVAVMTGTNFSSWFNSTAGTIYAEGAPITSTPNTYSFLVEGYTGSLAGSFTVGGGPTNLYGLDARIGGAGSNSNESIPITYTAGGVIKGSIAYETVGPTSGLVLNGTVYTANSNAPASVATSLYIGSRGGSTNIWNGWARRISFFNTKLTNAQLQTLTT